MLFNQVIRLIDSKVLSFGIKSKSHQIWFSNRVKLDSKVNILNYNSIASVSDFTICKKVNSRRKFDNPVNYKESKVDKRDFSSDSSDNEINTHLILNSLDNQKVSFLCFNRKVSELGSSFDLNHEAYKRKAYKRKYRRGNSG